MNFERLLADQARGGGHLRNAAMHAPGPAFERAARRRARDLHLARRARLARSRPTRSGAFAAPLPQGVYDLAIIRRAAISSALRARASASLGGYACNAIVRAATPRPKASSSDGEPSTADRRRTSTIASAGALAGSSRSSHVNGENDGTAYTTRTDRRGAFVVHGVRPGMYDLGGPRRRTTRSRKSTSRSRT